MYDDYTNDEFQMTAPSAAFLENELVFTTSRSGGPGGQNVNKVNSKVTLHFDVLQSKLLTAEQKTFLMERLSNKLTRQGILVLTAQDSRSQLENRQTVLMKFDKLMAKVFEKKKVRKATKPSKGAKQVRLRRKKVNSEKKKWRQKPDV
jgi:ribosome-associated protein